MWAGTKRKSGRVRERGDVGCPLGDSCLPTLCRAGPTLIYSTYIHHRHLCIVLTNCIKWIVYNNALLGRRVHVRVLYIWDDCTK